MVSFTIALQQFSEIRKLESNVVQMEKEKRIAEKDEQNTLKEKDQVFSKQMNFTQTPQPNSKVARIYLILLVFLTDNLNEYLIQFRIENEDDKERLQFKMNKWRIEIQEIEKQGVARQVFLISNFSDTFIVTAFPFRIV